MTYLICFSEDIYFCKLVFCFNGLSIKQFLAAND